MQRFTAARKVTIEQWAAEKFPEYVVDPHGRAGNDGFCSDLEQLRDCYSDLAYVVPDIEHPRWAWATIETHRTRPNAEDVIDGVVQDMHEDAYEDFDAAGLQKRLDEWFEAQDARSFMEDDSVAILLGDDFWAEDGDG